MPIALTRSCTNTRPHGAIERVPMLRGRIVAANGIKAEDLKPGEGSAWVLRGDRGITYAATVPEGSRLVAGEWWAADYAGTPLVSLENRTATDLNLKIGDTVTVNVLGRNVTARIANLRAVDWQSLGINFVMVFSPGTFAGAPHTDIATLTFGDGGSPAEETALIKALADIFPTVSAVRVKEALDAVDRLVSNLLAALRGASAVTLVAAALVLGGALAAGQRFRIYDAVILQDVGSDAATPARRLCARIFVHWSCRGCVRCRRRHARRRARRHARYGISVRMGAGPGSGGGARRASCYRHIGSGRNFCGTGPQARGGIEESLARRNYEHSVTRHKYRDPAIWRAKALCALDSARQLLPVFPAAATRRVPG